MMIISDTSLFVAKVLGAVFAGLYGLYATITDFHGTKDGRKVLTRTGKWGVALLLFASLINIGSDGVKQKQDLDSARKESIRRDEETKRLQTISAQEDEALRETQKTARTLGNAVVLLHATNEVATQNIIETQRVLDPIEGSMEASIQFRIPSDQIWIKPYSDRVKASLCSWSCALPSPMYKNDGSPIDEFPREGDRTVGNEGSLYSFLADTVFYINFYKGSSVIPSIAFRMDCNPPFNKDHQASLLFDGSQLYTGCGGKMLKVTDNAELLSYRDLLSARAEFRVSQLYVITRKNPYTPVFQFWPYEVKLYLAQGDTDRIAGRRLYLTNMRKTSCHWAPDDICFSALPKIEMPGEVSENN